MLALVMTEMLLHYTFFFNRICMYMYSASVVVIHLFNVADHLFVSKCTLCLFCTCRLWFCNLLGVIIIIASYLN